MHGPTSVASSREIGIRSRKKVVMGGFGFREILVVLLIVILFFGAKRIPELARGLGRGVKEFKDGMSEGEKGDGKSNTNEEKKP
jgi:sec-independent protein translocase protein TatA